MTAPAKRVHWDPDDLATAQKMRAAGESWSEIGRALGRNPGSVFGKLHGWQKKPVDVPRIEVPANDEIERQHRASLAHSSLTAAFCGDPLPGYSALDKRGGQV